MSYTAIYSPLKSVERDRLGARIEDMDGWRDWKGRDDWKGNAYEQAAIRDEKSTTEYPRIEYDVLYGFKTWGRREPDRYTNVSTSTLGCHFNVERFGYWYSRSDFESFWGDLSELTEPFYFYHPEPEYGIEEHGGDVIEHGPVSVLKVRCENGSVEVTEYELEARSVDTGIDQEADSDG